MRAGFERETLNDARSRQLQRAAGAPAFAEEAARAYERALADLASWEQAWAWLQAGDYLAAAEWFDRVSALPNLQRRISPEQRRALGRIGQALGRLVGPGADGDSDVCGDLPPLAVTSLGSFQIWRAGLLLPNCRASKAVALFRYLLTRTQWSAPRDELMDAIWPNARPREAAHSLHVAASTLRRFLDVSDTSYIVFAAGNYSINPAAVVDDDGAQFARHCLAADRFWRDGARELAQQAYTAALDCYANDYYVDDPDQTWAVAERERLLSRYLLVLERLGCLWADAGQHDRASECFLLLLERDLYREDIYLQLMQCYVACGRRGQALLQYQRCAATLASDLGLEPMPELQQLHQRIAGQERA